MSARRKAPGKPGWIRAIERVGRWWTRRASNQKATDRVRAQRGQQRYAQEGASIAGRRKPSPPKPTNKKIDGKAPAKTFASQLPLCQEEIVVRGQTRACGKLVFRDGRCDAGHDQPGLRYQIQARPEKRSYTGRVGKNPARLKGGQRG